MWQLHLLSHLHHLWQRLEQCSFQQCVEGQQMVKPYQRSSSEVKFVHANSVDLVFYCTRAWIQNTDPNHTKPLALVSTRLMSRSQVQAGRCTSRMVCGPSFLHISQDPSTTYALGVYRETVVGVLERGVDRGGGLDTDIEQQHLTWYP